MSEAAECVLDASALLCYDLDEPGAGFVHSALSRKAAISVVNLAEALSRLSDLGQHPDAVIRRWTEGGILGRVLLVHALDQKLARDIAVLRPKTRSLGLSLADRACLALARQLRVPVVTADRSWRKLHVGVKVQVIR